MNMTIGEKIKACRIKEGLTQKKLGELSGIAEPTIRKYESGRLNPKVETLEKICAALNVSVLYFLNMKSERVQTVKTIEISDAAMEQLEKIVNFENGFPMACYVEPFTPREFVEFLIKRHYEYIKPNF